MTKTIYYTTKHVNSANQEKVIKKYTEKKWWGYEETKKVKERLENKLDRYEKHHLDFLYNLIDE